MPVGTNKPKINGITPENPKWGDSVTVDYTFPDARGIEQAYVKGLQGGKLVAADGGYPLKTTFTLGPTMLADETQPADGVVQLTVGQDKNPSNDKVVAEYKFSISPASA